MLFDPKWEEKVEVKLEPWQEILLKAADTIEKHGWIKGAYHSRHGNCAVGAIMMSGGYRPDLIKSLRNSMTPDITEAMTQFQKNIGMSIPRWNDENGRTKEQVVAKLREIANAL